MSSDTKEMQAQLDRQRRKVDVDQYDFIVRELVRMAADKELKTAPAYQRKFRWSAYDESRLVESIFLGLPVPSIFVATNADSSWELVDGLQRVSTLIHFTADKPEILATIDQKEPLRLGKLETLSHFNNKTFAELPSSMQLAFQKRTLRVTALSDKSNRTVRFDLFERLNRGGIALSAQEVRACIFRGKYTDFLRDEASYENFLKLLKLQKKRQKDGTKEELVLKFFAYLRKREEFKGQVKEFLNDYMEGSADTFEKEADRALFRKTVDYLWNALGHKAFVRSKDKVTPLNPLEAFLVGIGEILSEGKTPVTPLSWFSVKWNFGFGELVTGIARFVRAQALYQSVMQVPRVPLPCSG